MGFAKKRSAMASVAICLVAASAVLLGGCSKVAGTTEVIIPDDLTGWALTTRVSESLNRCSSLPGIEARFYFIDKTTIRGVRSDGTFDYPTRSWSYTRTGEKSVRVRLDWTTGGTDVFDLTFTSGSTGRFESKGYAAGSLPCGFTHVRGSYRLDRIAD